MTFISDNKTQKNTENDEFNLNTEETNYKNLVSRLKEIKKIVASLEKTIFK